MPKAETGQVLSCFGPPISAAKSAQCMAHKAKIIDFWGLLCYAER